MDPATVSSSLPKAEENIIQEYPAKSDRSDSLEGYDDVARQKLLRTARRKIDRRLLAWHFILFFLMKLDNQNIANSAIMNLESGNGIQKELGNLTSAQWAWVISIMW